MTHVLMFCSQFRPIVGGAERQAEKLSKALARRGIRVTVLTPRLIDDTPIREESDGFVIHRFPLFDLCKRLPGLRGLGPLNLLSIRAQTMRSVSRNLGDVDIVHAHIASPMTAFAMRSAKKKGVPVLCKVAMAGARTDLGETSAIGLGGALLAKRMVSDLDCWVATTQAVRQSLMENGVAPGRITLIPNGVDLLKNFYQAAQPNLVRKFLYLGRLSKTAQRDVPTLIRAFSRAAKQIPDIQLALVGDGDLFQETAGMAAQSDHGHQIQMPGLAQPESWLQWADCFVLPSRREGLSNALLEAMSFGLPCIANDIQPNREVLDDGLAGILVPVGNEDSLCGEMLRVATNPELSKKLGTAALKRVRDVYSIEAVADQYITLYKQLTREI